MMNPVQDQQQNQIQIEVDDAIAQGLYANLAFLSHSETEFVLDFIFLQPQVPKAKVRSRIITSPAHAKKLLAALADNINKYESRFGKIQETSPLSADPKIGFYH